MAVEFRRCVAQDLEIWQIEDLEAKPARKPSEMIRRLIREPARRCGLWAVAGEQAQRAGVDKPGRETTPPAAHATKRVVKAQTEEEGDTL